MLKSFASLHPFVLGSWLVSFLYLLWALSGLIPLIPYDMGSESQNLGDAQALLDGQTRVGLLNYTHYPNGPTYLIAPFMALGIEKTTLRWIPVLCVWIGLLYWTLSLFRFLAPGPMPILTQSTILVLVFLFSNQANLIQWAGALSQQSYMSAGFFWGAALCFRKRPHPVEWWLCGTFVGWMGYDFLPTLLISIFGILTLKELFELPEKVSLKTLFKTLKKGFSKTRHFFSSLVFAVLAHFIQNVIYFKSIRSAFKDLVGSAAARMNSQNQLAHALNPKFASWLSDAESNHPSAKFSHLDTFWIAIKTSHYTPLSLYFSLAVGALTLGYMAWKYRESLKGSILTRWWALLTFTFGLGIVAKGIWGLCMKSHFIHHGWTLRHGMSSGVLGICFLTLTFRYFFQRVTPHSAKTIGV